MATPPTRPVQDAIIDPVWGQWVHDRLLGDPLGISAPEQHAIIHTRSGDTAIVADAASKLTVPMPTPFPNGVMGAWATSDFQGTESRFYVFDSASSTKSTLIFLAYRVVEVAGSPTLQYAANIGHYPAWFALGW